ncbi:NAD(P)/FAD-dependent oxidoreductase [Aurantimonas sp. VKM B-3413]|uniref:FAD/NAD(P)-dependent oxidoreductase n=1 Tax=Aurantimonas sp. VKM B-3413 TaxID=2779401 RepID=UPI001E3040F5|nr:NAD(P)/FAD-dependent oxidoreductase [Aurantimonas sp. VKM B-3413]MCB8840366.1 NAD(P)/FAD-dependent oxidoreductase [Aurantimonas sp. VKM B-3413]
MRRYDVVVIGAGPAGMACAAEASRAGLSTLVLDEQCRPGGQIYRDIEAADARRRGILGSDYETGADLAAELRASKAEYLPGAVVWNIDSEKQIDFSMDGGSRSVEAGHIVVATGAIERPTPMPGWTLPGVTTVGAAQILLKTSGVVMEDLVLVGSGPLLWLAATQLIAAGAPPKAIVETVPKARYRAAAKHLAKALPGWRYLAKGFAMMRAVKRAGVPVHRAAEEIVIEGETAARTVAFTSGGMRQRIETAHVALHQGVVPNQQITRLINCRHRFDRSQRAFLPVLDAHFETSVPGVFVAGDGAGIGGAKSAAMRGRLVAMRIAEKAGKSVAKGRETLQAELRRDSAVRPLLEALYAPSEDILSPADGTLVCRCEEITAGQIREAVALGAPGPNQVKSFLRAGMGPCQGRMCGLAVSEIIAAAKGEEPSSVDYYRIRPPLKPLLLSELAAFEAGEPPREAAE